MKNQWLSLLTACAVATTAGACSSQTSGPDTSSTAEPSATEQTAQAGLLLYDETANGIPVIARYPDTMLVMGTGSGEGVGVFFTFKPQGHALDEAEVHVFLPSGTASAAELEPFVTGPNGLMESNGWRHQEVGEGGTGRFPYAWVEKVIDFSTDQGQSGHILLGQTDGQAVQVTLLYPEDMADAYWPAARSILESLQFDGDLLPIRASNPAAPTAHLSLATGPVAGQPTTRRSSPFKRAPV